MMFNPYRDSSSVFSLIFGVAVPLIFALIGLIFGFIFAYLYNWLAPHIGGIKMNLVFHQDQE